MEVVQRSVLVRNAVSGAKTLQAMQTRLHFPVSGMSISSQFFIPAGFLRIPWDSCFFRRNFFHRNLLLAGGYSPPNYSGITRILRNSCSRKKNYRDLTQDHGDGDALDRLWPISWAVVNVRPRPSKSPYVLGRGHTSTTA